MCIRDSTIDGRFYNKAAVANGAMPINHGAMPLTTLPGGLGSSNGGREFDPVKKNQRCIFVLGVDAAGDVAVFQGEVIDSVARSNEDDGYQYPPCPKTHCPLGAIVVTADATMAGLWSMGVDNLSGVAGLTVDFHDLADMPSEPYLSLIHI